MQFNFQSEVVNMQNISPVHLKRNHISMLYFELHKIYHEVDIKQFIKFNRMNFAGIFRMNANNSITAKIFNHRQTTTRIRGRSRLDDTKRLKSINI